MCFRVIFHCGQTALNPAGSWFKLKPQGLTAVGQIFIFFLEDAGVWTQERCSWEREEHAGKA